MRLPWDVFGFHLTFDQYHTHRLDMLTETLRHLIPHEQIHPERQIALLERLPQFSHLGALLRPGEHHQIQVGLRARGPLDAGAASPDGHVRQVPVQQRQDRPALLGGDVDGGCHSHVSSLMVW